MTKLTFLILSISVFFSCSKDEIDFRDIEIVGTTFTHEIANCDNSGSPEINCTEFVHFVSDSTADVLIGGDDIITRLDYSRNEDQIILEQGPGITFDITFRIQNSQTLVRIEDNTTWLREVQ